MHKVFAAIGLSVLLSTSAFSQEAPAPSPVPSVPQETPIPPANPITADDYLVSKLSDLAGKFSFENPDRVSIVQICKVLEFTFNVDVLLGRLDAYVISSMDGIITVRLITPRGGAAERTLYVGTFNSPLIFLSGASEKFKKKSEI